MSSVIEFLERMGADASLRHANAEAVAQAVASADVDAEVGAAIIARSVNDLHAKLNVTPMFCVQMDPQKEDEEEEEGEDEEEEEKSAFRQHSAVALAD